MLSLGSMLAPPLEGTHTLRSRSPLGRAPSELTRRFCLHGLSEIGTSVPFPALSSSYSDRVSEQVVSAHFIFIR